MATRLGSVSESNENPASILTGRLNTGSLAGMVVLGVNFAGRQSGNVGTDFEGIFGTLRVNADGSFSYVLDNTDTDTDLLTTGERAFERFVVTYRLGGTVHTLAVEVAIDGIDEPEQVNLTYDEEIRITDDMVIGRHTSVRFVSSIGYAQGFRGDQDANTLWDFTNLGSIRFTSDGSNRQGYAAGPVPPQGRIMSHGRLVAESHPQIIGDIYGMLGFGENSGVVSAINRAPFNPAYILGRAIGGEGIDANSGLIEAISTLDAYGVWAFGGGRLINSGFIYVEGGAAYPSADRTDPLGIIGLHSGSSDDVTNSGTVHVVSNSDFVRSVGFSLFPPATNIYDPTRFDNSGTIVADRVIIALGGFQSSMYLNNSGHIEGTFELDRGGQPDRQLRELDWELDDGLRNPRHDRQ